MVGSLGVSPGLPLRTLAAGHPGPRSLGCPLRFGPPGVACSHTPAGQPRAHPSLTVLRTACPPLRGGLRPGVCKREGATGWVASGTGPRAAKRPRRSRGAFGPRGPVPFNPVTNLLAAGVNSSPPSSPPGGCKADAGESEGRGLGDGDSVSERDRIHLEILLRLPDRYESHQPAARALLPRHRHQAERH